MKDDVVPKGYITGLLREPGSHQNRVAHLYKGDFHDPGNPMCINGWNRYDHTEYSIWRGNVGRKGICKTCLKRANADLEPVGPSD